jgi:non-ribosomal peptide synthetase component F
LTIQYADFAHWQRQQFREKVLKADLVYWKRVLGGTLPRLSWPLKDFPFSERHDEDFESLLIADEMTHRLRMLSRGVGVTLYMTMLAGLKTVLVHLTGQTDLLVGSPVSGRRYSKTAGLIGRFVNVLALRTGLSRDLSFHEVLLKIRTMTLEAYAHQDWPWELVLRELQPELCLRKELPFQVVFNYIARTPGTGFLSAERSLGPARLTPASFRDEWPAFAPTALIVTEEESNLRVDMCYPRGLFSRDEAAGLLQRFNGLLEQIVTAPEKPIGSYTV